MKVTAVNCNNNKPGTVGPGHYFLVAELDGWTQIMATYGFLDSSACWDIFGHANAYARGTNVQEFKAGLDLIGPQMNMARSMAGAALPYDGRTTACDETPGNFWSKSYANAPKSARVVLRRVAAEKPAGLSIGSDCGFPSWRISDIHVR